MNVHIVIEMCIRDRLQIILQAVTEYIWCSPTINCPSHLIRTVNSLVSPRLSRVLKTYKPLKIIV